MQRLLPAVTCLLALGHLGLVPTAGHAGAAEVAITDKGTGQPVPCRLHVKDAAGKPQRAAKLPFWHDHFVCPGAVSLELVRARASQINGCALPPGHAHERRLGRGGDGAAGPRPQRVAGGAVLLGTRASGAGVDRGRDAHR